MRDVAGDALKEQEKMSHVGRTARELFKYCGLYYYYW
jgi:hypothetical protein